MWRLFARISQSFAGKLAKRMKLKNLKHVQKESDQISEGNTADGGPRQGGWLIDTRETVEKVILVRAIPW
jgi:hypothetical protein